MYWYTCIQDGIPENGVCKRHILQPVLINQVECVIPKHCKLERTLTRTQSMQRNGEGIPSSMLGLSAKVETSIRDPQILQLKHHRLRYHISIKREHPTVVR